MKQALEGEEYCKEHQGNHSHYDSKNCRVCKMEKEIDELTRNFLSAYMLADIFVNKVHAATNHEEDVFKELKENREKMFLKNKPAEITITDDGVRVNYEEFEPLKYKEVRLPGLLGYRNDNAERMKKAIFKMTEQLKKTIKENPPKVFPTTKSEFEKSCNLLSDLGDIFDDVDKVEIKAFKKETKKRKKKQKQENLCKLVKNFIEVNYSKDPCEFEKKTLNYFVAAGYKEKNVKKAIEKLLIR